MTEPTKLPGRDFFTLEETAERWGLDIEELEHWARQNLLKTKVGTTGAGLSIKPLVTGISRAERDRFEREHQLGPSAPKKPQGHVDPRERRALLNIIGALLELVKNPEGNPTPEDESKRKTTETPKPGPLSDSAVIRKILDAHKDKNDRAPYGLSPENLKDKFRDARRQLESEG